MGRCALPSLVLLLASCAAPSAEESALLLLDDDARAAGVAVEVEGAAVESELPVPVDADSETWLVRPTGDRERLALAPGELVEIHGASGEVRRGTVEPDRLVIHGTRAGALELAELLGGARVEPLAGAGFALHAPGVTWVAALLHDQLSADRRLAGVRAASPFEHALAGGDGAWSTRDVVSLEAPAEPRASDASVPDAAALVGAYAYSDVLFVLDAAGGYLLRTAEGTTRGAYRPCPGGVELTPEGGAPFRLQLRDESLVDGVGLALAPLEAPVSIGGGR